LLMFTDVDWRLRILNDVDSFLRSVNQSLPPINL
jgi:hypothetical protein